ncbi:hypothetical protein T492DRAFT_870775 [Pavlovales sp. CCMP2436]|nr:hypothetical protein T492DRAFT_870775 [Pavlovales sp. CCMP2436]
MSGHELSDAQITQTVVDQSYRKLADEHLADYKVQADADMYEGFSAFLSGDLQKDTTDRYVDVPFVGDRGILRHVDLDSVAGLQVLDNVQAKCVPWEDHHLLHIPGAHEFLTSEYRKRKQFDIYIGTLYAMGPQSMEQAWHYYKYIVKQQRPTDRELEVVVAAFISLYISLARRSAVGGRGLSGNNESWERAKGAAIVVTEEVDGILDGNAYKDLSGGNGVSICCSKKYGHEIETKFCGLVVLLTNSRLDFKPFDEALSDRIIAGRMPSKFAAYGQKAHVKVYAAFEDEQYVQGLFDTDPRYLAAIVAALYAHYRQRTGQYAQLDARYDGKKEYSAQFAAREAGLRWSAASLPTPPDEHGGFAPTGASDPADGASAV